MRPLQVLALIKPLVLHFQKTVQQIQSVFDSKWDHLLVLGVLLHLMNSHINDIVQNLDNNLLSKFLMLDLVGVHLEL
jgi:hypothetical protein